MEGTPLLLICILLFSHESLGMNINVQTCSYLHGELSCKISKSTLYEVDRLLKGVTKLTLLEKGLGNRAAEVRIRDLMPDLESVRVVGQCEMVKIDTPDRVAVSCEKVCYISNIEPDI